MTAKRRIRERQAKTGESYTAARAQVLAQADAEPQTETTAKPSAFPVVELIDATDIAARAEAGIGGLTQTGDMLAFTVEGVMVIAQAGYVPDMPPIPRTHKRHRLFLTGVAALHLDGSAMVLPR